MAIEMFTIQTIEDYVSDHHLMVYYDPTDKCLLSTH
jgi:hypothetical protein